LAKRTLFPNYLKKEWLQATLPVPAEGQIARDRRRGRWDHTISYICTNKNGVVDFRMLLQRPGGAFETHLYAVKVAGHDGYALGYLKIDNKELSLKSRRDIFNALFFLDERLRLMRLFNHVPKPHRESTTLRLLKRLLPIPPKYR